LFHKKKDAFWMLVRLVEFYGMGGLWDSGLTDVPKMCFIHDALLAKFAPRVRAHLDAQGISGALYAPSFYITGFSYSLPWPCVLRVWDAFFCFGGLPVLHAVGVALLQMHEEQLLGLEFEKLMPFLRFNHVVESDGREAAGGHISHVELADRLLKWLPKVAKALNGIAFKYVPEPARGKKK
jgi:hypothetical protein